MTKQQTTRTSIFDCIYFWSTAEAGEESEIVDKPLDDGFIYEQMGSFVQEGNNLVVKGSYIKNPVYKHSGLLYLSNEVNFRDTLNIDYRCDVTNHKSTIYEDVKAEIRRNIKELILLDFDK